MVRRSPIGYIYTSMDFFVQEAGDQTWRYLSMESPPHQPLKACHPSTKQLPCEAHILLPCVDIFFHILEYFLSLISFSQIYIFISLEHLFFSFDIFSLYNIFPSPQDRFLTFTSFSHIGISAWHFFSHASFSCLNIFTLTLTYFVQGTYIGLVFYSWKVPHSKGCPFDVHF